MTDWCVEINTNDSLSEPKNSIYPYSPSAVYQAMLENNPGRMAQDYPWMISPHYSADVNGLLQPVPGEYTLYHRNFGRFLSSGGNSNGVETVINPQQQGVTSGYCVWVFVNSDGSPVNLNPATMVAGTYFIQHKLTGQYLCGNPGNHVFLQPGSSTGSMTNSAPPASQWSLTSVSDVLQDVFYVQNVSVSKYLKALGNTLTTLKTLFTGYLPAINGNNRATGIGRYNFMCQNGYHNIYNHSTESTVADCCGNNESFDSLSRDMTAVGSDIGTWSQALDNWPCMDSLPSNSNIQVCYWPFGANQPMCSTETLSMTYNASDAYAKCISNWTNSVINNTMRTPCEPFAYFPDPDPTRRGQQRQMPIPSATYLACLQFQQQPQAGGACLTYIPYLPGGTGRSTTGSDFVVSAQSFCMCNCQSDTFGVDQATCASLCTGIDPAQTAEVVQTSGFQWTPSTRQCGQTTSNSGQFPSMAICNGVVAASPNGPAVPGGGGSGGPFGMGPVLIAIVLIILLILAGIWLDRVRRAS